MPAILESKKDINDYEKEFWKTHKDKMKELKAKAKADAKAEAKAAKPAKRKNAVDEDGNVKEKRAPTAYNIFVKEQRSIVKEACPKLNNKEIFAEIAIRWKVHKGEIVAEDKTEDFVDAKESLEDKEDDEDDEEDEDYEVEEEDDDN
jgi:hypothetical protein